MFSFFPCAGAASLGESFFFHAHNPSADVHEEVDTADAFTSSFFSSSAPGVGDGMVLEAMGEGPVLLKADTAATSLEVLVSTIISLM